MNDRRSFLGMMLGAIAAMCGVKVLQAVPCSDPHPDADCKPETLASYAWLLDQIGNLHDDPQVLRLPMNDGNPALGHDFAGRWQLDYSHLPAVYGPPDGFQVRITTRQWQHDITATESSLSLTSQANGNCRSQGQGGDRTVGTWRQIVDRLRQCETGIFSHDDSTSKPMMRKRDFVAMNAAKTVIAILFLCLVATGQARACNGSQALFQSSAVVSQPFLVQQSAFVVQPSFIVQPTNTVLLTGGGFFGGTAFVGGGFGGNSLFIGGGRRNNSLFIGNGGGGGSLFVNERRGLFGGLRERTVIQNGAGGSSFFQQRRGRR